MNVFNLFICSLKRGGFVHPVYFPGLVHFLYHVIFRGRQLPQESMTHAPRGSGAIHFQQETPLPSPENFKVPRSGLVVQDKKIRPGQKPRVKWGKPRRSRIFKIRIVEAFLCQGPILFFFRSLCGCLRALYRPAAPKVFLCYWKNNSSFRQYVKPAEAM